MSYVMIKEKMVPTLIALVKVIEWSRFITNGSLEYAFTDGFFCWVQSLSSLG